MGIIRSVPDRQVSTNHDNFPDLNYAEAAVCGWQHQMEDHTGHATINNKVRVFYVIDGHAGPDVAELANQMIPELLGKSDLVKMEQYKPALQNMFETLDSQLKKQAPKCSAIREKHGLPPSFESYPASGCSIVLALVSDSQIVIANIGECKAYVCYSTNLSKAVMISGNHTESNSQDEARVRAAGGFFLEGRVNGIMPFTRSIGDYALKTNEFVQEGQQMISPVPSVFSLRKQDIKYVLLGSGGLWQQPELVLRHMTEEDVEIEQIKEKARQLLQKMICQDPKQTQIGLKNMTLMMLDLKH